MSSDQAKPTVAVAQASRQAALRSFPMAGTCVFSVIRAYMMRPQGTQVCGFDLVAVERLAQ